MSIAEIAYCGGVSNLAHLTLASEECGLAPGRIQTPAFSARHRWRLMLTPTCRRAGRRASIRWWPCEPSNTRQAQVSQRRYNESMMVRSRGVVVVLGMFPCVLFAQHAARELPATASSQLARSLAAAAAHTHHLWRDSPPMNSDGTVNGYIEISRGDRRKYEFDMSRNTRAIDRVVSKKVGGYPVNYGFVPQTVSYDGDPFDVLVLGPPLAGGKVVRGVIVGLMYMEDEKGPDSKVVLSPVTPDGRAKYDLTSEIRKEIADYFRRYKQGEPGKFSKVPGWGTVNEGRDLLTTTHAFFRECSKYAGTTCRVPALQ
jgi:inorganic pyrophosphatase